MIGLVLQEPVQLEETSLVTGFNKDTCIYGEVYSSTEYTYPFSYTFTGDNAMTASAVTQKLIDNGCTMIIHLGTCKSPMEGILNVVNLVSPKVINRSPRFVKFSGQSITSGSLQCVMDSADVIDRAYDYMSAGIVNTCVLNNVQVLMLMRQFIGQDRLSYYAELGEALLTKFELILKTDYEYYDKQSEELSVLTASATQAFSPVNTSPMKMQLPTRFRSSD